MTYPSELEFRFVLLFGAFCVAGALVGLLAGLRNGGRHWISYFGLTTTLFGLVAALFAVGLLWLTWHDYDKDVRATIVSAVEDGLPVRHETQTGSGTVYVIEFTPKASISLVWRPFRPSIPFVISIAVGFGLAVSIVSLAFRRLTKMCFPNRSLAVQAGA